MSEIKNDFIQSTSCSKEKKMLVAKVFVMDDYMKFQ